MQREPLYLADILDASDAIAALIEGFDKATFLADPRTQAAVAFHLSNIGEAARNISDELKHRYPWIEWHKARTMRNVLAHQYFAINWSIVWDTATHDIPVLRGHIATVLTAEFPDIDVDDERYSLDS
jgi:uncharacterized protein with HEPN domain